MLWQDPSASAAKLPGISVERRGVCGPVGRRVLTLDASGAPDPSPSWCKWKCLLVLGPQFHPSLLSYIHYPKGPTWSGSSLHFHLCWSSLSTQVTVYINCIFSYSNPSYSSYLTPDLYTSCYLCNIVLSLHHFTWKKWFILHITAYVSSSVQSSLTLLFHPRCQVYLLCTLCYSSVLFTFCLLPHFNTFV